jgi:hypothetical protein
VDYAKNSRFAASERIHAGSVPVFGEALVSLCLWLWGWKNESECYIASFRGEAAAKQERPVRRLCPNHGGGYYVGAP